jgi:hypothetical protein
MSVNGKVDFVPTSEKEPGRILERRNFKARGHDSGLPCVATKKMPI